MRDSFVFYHSFYMAARQAPNFEMQKEILWYLVECCLGEKEYSEVPFPSSAIVVPILESVNASKKRYEKTVEGGKRGGRPSKWVDRPEAERLFAEYKSWSKVAEIMDVSEDTLYRARMKWKSDSAKPQNPQNLTDTVTDTVTVTETVTGSVINNKLPGNTATDPNGSPCTVEKNGAKRPEAEPTPEESRAVIDRLIAATPERERKPNAGREHNSS